MQKYFLKEFRASHVFILEGSSGTEFHKTQTNENMMLNDGIRSEMPGKPRLLLIQQHLPTAMSLVSLLTQGGCDVKVATDGKGALQIAQEHGFDLIALDPDLADGNGFETFLRLRQVPTLAAIPIVFVARHFDDANWRRGLELGAADYIEKPFDGPAFVRRILSHIKTRLSYIKIS
jgi:putative two-component system response regulator